MVSKAVKKCLRVIECLFDMGFRFEVPESEVRMVIEVQIGADKRTVNKYLKMLTETLGFLEKKRRSILGIYIYQLNIEKIENFIEKYAKEEAKRLKQLTLLEIKRREEEVLAKKS